LLDRSHSDRGNPSTGVDVMSWERCEVFSASAPRPATRYRTRACWFLALEVTKLVQDAKVSVRS